MKSRLVLTLHPCLAVAGTLLAVTMLVPAAPSTEPRLEVEGQKLVVESRTFRAEFDGASLVRVRSSDGNTEFLRLDTNSFPVELVYANNDRLRQDKGQVVTVKLLSEYAARIVVTGNDSDRELFVRLDPDSGDLCVTPSGRSARRGVLAARWNLPFAREAALVLPCINGMFIESDREFPGNDRFPWPYRWNAQLAIAQRGGQTHIHDGWGELKPHHILAAHPICSFLWQGHTRLVGYYHCGPKDKDAEIGVEIYRRMGAIPTLICNDPTLIGAEQPIVKKIVDRARSVKQSAQSSRGTR